MSNNSKLILSNQTHPGSSEVESIIGDPFKGDGYYGRSDGFHTVQINVNNFIGTIKIQGTLAINPSEGDWFSVELESGGTSIVGFVDTTGAINTQSATVSSITYTENETSVNNYNFTGNYVWVRAVIEDWIDGSVNSIQLNH